MKKYLLIIAICAGAVSMISAVILIILCSDEMVSFIKKQVDKIKLTGRKTGEKIEGFFN